VSGTKRRLDPGLARQLLAHPERFQFFQAMRVLERLYRRQPGWKKGGLAGWVRFRNSLSLAFPASELDADADVRTRQGERVRQAEDMDRVVAEGELGLVELTPHFMGLLGVTGALPLHYTELLHEREVFRRDRGARAFLDMFTTRAVTLHYEAWKKHRLALQYELDRRERFMPLLMSLAGLGPASTRDALVDGHGDVFDQSVAYYAGAIRQRPVSATMLARVLSDHFRVPFRIEQFVGAWYPLPPAQATRLGQAQARLGVSTLAGGRVFQRDLRLRLSIGPLHRRAFDDFLPGASGARALRKWLELLGDAGLEYEIRLCLRPQDVPGMRMSAEAGPRLGWDSYLGSRPQTRARDDTRYHIQFLH
jgi:type VI secretion system protein ImpH